MGSAVGDDRGVKGYGGLKYSAKAWWDLGFSTASMSRVAGAAGSKLLKSRAVTVSVVEPLAMFYSDINYFRSIL